VNALPFSSKLLLALVAAGFCPRQKGGSCIPYLTNTSLRQTAIGKRKKRGKKK